MTYSKPEVALLGDAARVIQTSQMSKTGSVLEQSSGQFIASPAYDLDD